MVIIANSATGNLFITDYHKAASGLQTSMNRLASGDRIGLGDAPADLGISERFRAQILNSEEAGRVIQNAVNMFTSSDGWLQEVQNMMNRMGQLAISASDSSKNAGDRANLNFEFQELKEEIARVAQAGKYNGLAVNSSTAIATYDFNTNTIAYRQSDGSDERVLPFSFQTGAVSANGLDYGLVNTSGDNGEYVADFIFSEDGKYLYWINQVDSDATVETSGIRVNKLELDTNFMTQTAVLSNLSLGENFRNMNQLVMGEDGEEIEDPRVDLVHRILDYKRFKNASKDLDSQYDSHKKKFSKGMNMKYDPSQDISLYVSEDVKLFDLARTFKNILEALPENNELDLVADQIRVKDQIVYINQVLDEKGDWDYRRTCVEGPIFDSRAIQWDAMT